MYLKDYLSKFNKYLLKGIDYEIIDEKNNNYIPKIYEFNDIDDEVECVAYEICKLIDSGVDIKNIKLTNVSNDYVNIVNKIFGFYNLRINKKNSSPLISSIIGSTFYNNFVTTYIPITSIIIIICMILISIKIGIKKFASIKQT